MNISLFLICLRAMIYLILAVLGLCFGSFVNALVWRIHEQEKQSKAKSSKFKEKKQSKNKKTKSSELSAQDSRLSIVHGRSMCVDCKHELAAQDLVPVFSWLWLRGKCRYCKKPISWQYPLVEVATASLFVLSYACWPKPLTSLGVFQLSVWLVFVVGFMALVIYDLRWMLLPNRIVFPLYGLAAFQLLVVLAVERDPHILLNAFIGFLIIGGFFYALFQLSGGKWIGGGDVKLGFLLGVLAGDAYKAILVLFVASTSGSLISLPLLLSGKAKRTTRIPFGPFLILGMVVVQLFGTSIIAWYKKLLLF